MHLRPTAETGDSWGCSFLLSVGEPELSHETGCTRCLRVSGCRRVGPRAPSGSWQGETALLSSKQVKPCVTALPALTFAKRVREWPAARSHLPSRPGPLCLVVSALGRRLHPGITQERTRKCQRICHGQRLPRSPHPRRMISH